MICPWKGQITEWTIINTTHMKEKSKEGGMAITLLSRGPFSRKLHSFFTASSFTGNTTTKPWNVEPPPSIPSSSDPAKINPTYKSGTCPVLLSSGNAWGEHRSVSINFSSQIQINEWSRRERGRKPVWLLWLDIHQESTGLTTLSYLIHTTLGKWILYFHEI